MRKTLAAFAAILALSACVDHNPRPGDEALATAACAQYDGALFWEAWEIRDTRTPRGYINVLCRNRVHIKYIPRS